eukprot:scaffold104495_cov36-Phaeocystis_antarctica.AAC.1
MVSRVCVGRRLASSSGVCRGASRCSSHCVKACPSTKACSHSALAGGKRAIQRRTSKKSTADGCLMSLGGTIMTSWYLAISETKKRKKAALTLRIASATASSLISARGTLRPECSAASTSGGGAIVKALAALLPVPSSVLGARQ